MKFSKGGVKIVNKEKRKHVEVTPELSRKLLVLKAQGGFRSVNDAIEDLLKN